MKIKKTSIIFIILNFLLLILGYFFLENHTIGKIDNFFYSKMNQLFQDEYHINGENDVVLLKIDKEFFENMGVTISTLHRGYYAKLAQKLKEYEVANIIFDVYFGDLKYSEKENKVQNIYNKSLKIFDKELKKEITENVVLGAIPNGKFSSLPSKDLLKNGTWVGQVKSHTNKDDINDGVYPFLVGENGNKILTLGYEGYLNRLYNLGKIEKDFEISIKKGNNIFSQNLLEIKTSNPKYSFSIPLSVDYIGKKYLLTPLFLSLDKIRSYSIYDILTDEDGIYKSILKGKTIFIGATDETLNDIKLSYLGLVPGVIFHINQFLSLYAEKYFYVTSVPLSFTILTIIFIISYIFVIAFKDEKMSIISFVGFVIFLTISFYYFFINFGILIPLGGIITILGLKLVLDILHILFINQERKRFVTKLFNRYIGDKVLEKKGETDGNVADKKNIAIMFSDIKNFTNISEKLQASEVINMLNIYFDKTNTSIIRSNGFIDKYIGDAIMAFWEDFENIDVVIDSAIQIQKVHPKIIEIIENTLGKKINVETRIGLHYGEAIIGDVGDSRNKISYTAIGDSVNLANRLEGINKYYNTKIIISEEVYKKIKNKDEYAIRMIDKITVKGKKEVLKIYEVMSLYKEEISKDLQLYIKDFESAIENYFDGNFNKTKEIFSKLEILSLGENDPVLKVFNKRIEFLTKNIPNTWDGVWKFETK